MSTTLSQSLINSLTDFFTAHDFVPLEAYHQFKKEHEGGFSNVIISVGNSLPALAELHVGIRLNLVEQLAYQFTSGLTEYSPHSTTFITSAGRILNQPYHRYPLERPSDIELVAEQMKQFMHFYGFDFITRYQGIRPLDELFNAEPYGKSLYFTNRLHRSLRGIILAKLTHRDHWPRLVIGYRAQLTLRGTPEPMMRSYDRLVDYLRTFSVN